MPFVTTPVLSPSSTAAGRVVSGAAGMDSAERIMVTAALAGDDEAFETVIRTYSRRVYVVAYAILQDVPEAEDIVQETFLKAHHQRGKLREPEKFPAWLLTVTRNGARDRLRRRRPQADAETFETLATVADPSKASGEWSTRPVGSTSARTLKGKVPQ